MQRSVVSYRYSSGMSTMTHLYTVVPVRDLEQARDWYSRFFGRTADHEESGEVLWGVTETAWVALEADAGRAGTATMTIGVDDVDPLLERLAGAGVPHEPVETYGNGVRHVVIPDPDGNRIALAAPPEAAAGTA